MATLLVYFMVFAVFSVLLSVVIARLPPCLWSDRVVTDVSLERGRTTGAVGTPRWPHNSDG